VCRDRPISMRRLTAIAGLLVAGLLGSAPTAGARTPWRPCDQGRLSCARVAVALDPNGRVPGRVSLFVERYAVAEHPTGTIVALPGGPGQSGVDLFARFRNDFQRLLGTRALVIFDERGVGRSEPLDCRVPASEGLRGASISTCAASLGRPGDFYSTADTVADLEAIRRTLGLGRIDLYGVSYGTFPATQYARRYPSHVAHLLLDSALPADGDLDVNLDSLRSARRQLASICAVACRDLDPSVDLARFLARAPASSGNGRHGLRIDRTTAGRVILNALNAADLDPFVRASIPAALRLAAGGEPSAVVRLGDLAVASETAEAAVGATPAAGSSNPATIAIDAEPLATRCEDERFPWSVGDPLAVREAKVRRAESRLSPAAVAPFTARVVFAGAVIDDCERWPTAGAAPPREPGSLPAVPTLILSGENDVRTSLEQADALAAAIPGASVLEVPNVGHAVLADDRSGCTKRAVFAFLGGDPVAACPPGSPPPADPLPPASLAALAPAGGLSGEPGDVLTACVLTLRHDVGLVAPYLVPGLAVAGTAGGGLVDRSVGGRATAELQAISYIRSVSLTGGLTGHHGYARGLLTVRVYGHPYGTLELAANGTITGRLGGRRLRLASAERQAIDTAHGLDFATQLA
jgi:pimeloyl-ACP methyl ester carboxylesterase